MPYTAAPPVRGPMPPIFRTPVSAEPSAEAPELAVLEEAVPVLADLSPPPQPAIRLTHMAPARSMARYFFIFIYLLE